MTSDLVPVCCCRYSQADQWEALLGLHVQSLTSEWTVRRNVRRIIAHSEYNPLSYNNDIALMELDASVNLNQNIWPICLPSPTYDFPAGQDAWITGWGATREGGEWTLSCTSEVPHTSGDILGYFQPGRVFQSFKHVL